MNISVKEFRQIIEEHTAEHRQWQDDYNLMADEKEGEIKSLEKKLEAIENAFKEFRDRVVEIASPELEGTIKELYVNLLDGLAGY